MLWRRSNYQWKFPVQLFVERVWFVGIGDFRDNSGSNRLRGSAVGGRTWLVHQSSKDAVFDAVEHLVDARLLMWI